MVSWGDGTITSVPGGWRPGGPLLLHAYTAPGRYVIEYQSQRGQWSGMQSVTVNVTDAQPPPSGPFSRQFTLADEAGQPLVSPISVNSFTLVHVRPQDMRATTSVILWGAAR